MSKRKKDKKAKNRKGSGGLTVSVSSSADQQRNLIVGTDDEFTMLLSPTFDGVTGLVEPESVNVEFMSDTYQQRPEWITPLFLQSVAVHAQRDLADFTTLEYMVLLLAHHHEDVSEAQLARVAQCAAQSANDFDRAIAALSEHTPMFVAMELMCDDADRVRASLVFNDRFMDYLRGTAGDDADADDRVSEWIHSIDSVLETWLDNPDCPQWLLELGLGSGTIDLVVSISLRHWMRLSDEVRDSLRGSVWFWTNMAEHFDLDLWSEPVLELNLIQSSREFISVHSEHGEAA